MTALLKAAAKQAARRVRQSAVRVDDDDTVEIFLIYARIRQGEPTLIRATESERQALIYCDKYNEFGRPITECFYTSHFVPNGKAVL